MRYVLQSSISISGMTRARSIAKNLPVTITSHSGQHVRRGTGYGKVEEPLRCSSEGDVHGPKACAWYLRYVDPACCSPAKLANFQLDMVCIRYDRI